MFKDLGRSVFSKLFDNRSFRDKAIFHLKQYYYHELGVVVDLGNGYTCPVADPAALYSFTEIFFENEYASVFEEINLPSKWLDLGCHYGFFTLYVSWMRRKQLLSGVFKALMVDADSRVLPGISSLVKLNNLESHVSFMYGAIASGSGSVYFSEQEVMSSALADPPTESLQHSTKRVPIVDQSMILDSISPPYDLVKIDVEGGEYDFFLAYDKILSATQNLVVEWHSWHRGGGSSIQIQELATAYGFQMKKEIKSPTPCGNPVIGNHVGVYLFSKPEI
jgi:FkbM family methyltransferase